MTEGLKEVREPEDLLGCSCTSIELGLAARKGNRWRAGCTPTDKAGAKGGAVALAGATVHLVVCPRGVCVAREDRGSAAKGEAI